MPPGTSRKAEGTGEAFRYQYHVVTGEFKGTNHDWTIFHSQNDESVMNGCRQGLFIISDSTDTLLRFFAVDTSSTWHKRLDHGMPLHGLFSSSLA